MSLATHSQYKSTNTQWEYNHKWHEKGKEDEEEENQIVEAPNLFQSSNLCFNLSKIPNPSTPKSLQASKSPNPLCYFSFFPFKHSFSSEKWWGGNFLRDHAAAQSSEPKSCRGMLFLCNSGSIWVAAQKFNIESCRGSVLFLLKIDFFPSKWVTPMCFGLLSFILTSHLTCL